MKIVIKIGTAAIFDLKRQEIKAEVIRDLARDISDLIKRGDEVIIVSSGAVGCGKKLIHGENGLGLRQAQASVGQVKLMQEYSEMFATQKLNIAQFLLNLNDLNDKIRMQNIRETYNHLKGKIIPIVNENDTTSTEELSFGDNDFLAAELVLKLNFDVLIILTEIGALIKNNKQVKESQLFSIEDYDKMNIPLSGFGGLKSKLLCAKKMAENKKLCIIAKAGDSIPDILSRKAESTRFHLR